MMFRTRAHSAGTGDSADDRGRVLTRHKSASWTSAWDSGWECNSKVRTEIRRGARPVRDNTAERKKPPARVRIAPDAKILVGREEAAQLLFNQRPGN